MNNFNRIKYYLDFREGHFYFLQIIARKKDNPQMPHVTVLRSFCIDDEEYYWKIEDTVADMCSFFNARAYIRLNIRSYEQTAFKMMKNTAEYLYSGQYKASRSAFWSAAGKHNAQNPKFWIIDLDGDETNKLNDVVGCIKHLQKEIREDYECYGTIPTPNGKHLITNPFNVAKFKKNFPDVEIKKDGPTILYSFLG